MLGQTKSAYGEKKTIARVETPRRGVSLQVAAA